MSSISKWSSRKKNLTVIAIIFSFFLVTNIIDKHNQAKEAERKIKVLAEINRLEQQNKEAEERRLDAEEAMRKAEEKTFKAVITECYVDAPCKSFDRVAVMTKTDVRVGDFTCSIKGSPGVDGYGACSVSILNGIPVSMRQWDPNDGFVTSKVTFGPAVKRGQYDPELEANPHLRLQREQ